MPVDCKNKGLRIYKEIMNGRWTRIISLLVVLIIGIVAGGYIGAKTGIPFAQKIPRWSIGIYEGESALHVTPPSGIKNPVLTAADVTDIPAGYVADPFMIKAGSSWYMFFEAWNLRTKQGDIGCATSNNGLDWNYQKIVIDEPTHLAYPYVFEYEGDYYLIPDSGSAYSVNLYKAVDFPYKWSRTETLLYGDFADTSIFLKDGLWWFYTSDRHDVLRLYYSNQLIGGKLVEHPQSPLIIGDANISNPGGRVLDIEGRTIRIAQDCDPDYGNAIRAFEVTTLTTTDYKEHEITDVSSLKASGHGWNKTGMHNFDAHQISPGRWIACVDGYYWGYDFSIKF
jgi:hypothetical protein